MTQQIITKITENIPPNRYGVSFEGDGNVLKLDSSDGFIKERIY